MPTNLYEIVSDFLTEQEKELIRKSADQRVSQQTGKRATELRVRELGRVGKSGARLLLCKIDGGVPFVIKIAERKKIADEFTAIDSVRNYFRLAAQGAKP